MTDVKMGNKLKLPLKVHLGDQRIGGRLILGDTLEKLAALTHTNIFCLWCCCFQL